VGATRPQGSFFRATAHTARTEPPAKARWPILHAMRSAWLKRACASSAPSQLPRTGTHRRGAPVRNRAWAPPRPLGPFFRATRRTRPAPNHRRRPRPAPSQLPRTGTHRRGAPVRNRAWAPPRPLGSFFRATRRTRPAPIHRRRPRPAPQTARSTPCHFPRTGSPQCGAPVRNRAWAPPRPLDPFFRATRRTRPAPIHRRRPRPAPQSARSTPQSARCTSRGRVRIGVARRLGTGRGHLPDHLTPFSAPLGALGLLQSTGEGPGPPPSQRDAPPADGFASEWRAG
jgi:hypothetical protein